MHWTQTPEGRERVSEMSKAAWASGLRKGPKSKKSVPLIHPSSNYRSAKSLTMSRAMKKYWRNKKKVNPHGHAVIHETVSVNSTVIDAARKLAHDVVDVRLSRELTKNEKEAIDGVVKLLDTL